jgi:hypothetical protein
MTSSGIGVPQSLEPAATVPRDLQIMATVRDSSASERLRKESPPAHADNRWGAGRRRAARAPFTRCSASSSGCASLMPAVRDAALRPAPSPARRCQAEINHVCHPPLARAPHISRTSAIRIPSPTPTRNCRHHFGRKAWCCHRQECTSARGCFPLAHTTGASRREWPKPACHRLA